MDTQPSSSTSAAAAPAAVSPEKKKLGPEDFASLKELYRQMMVIRRIEEAAAKA